MTHIQRDRRCGGMLLPVYLMAVAMWVSPTQAQSGFELPSQLSGLSAASSDPAENLDISASFRVTPDGRRGLLSVTAVLGGHWHVYSITQRDGGPMRTKIVLEPSKQYQVVGPFAPDQPPRVRRLDYYDVPVEEHADRVTWRAVIQLAPGMSPERLEIAGRLDGQICDDQIGCVPLTTLDTQFTARLEGTIRELPNIGGKWAAQMSGAAEIRRTPAVQQVVAKDKAAVSPIPANLQFTEPGREGFRVGSVHVTLNGRIEPAAAKPGDTVNLVIAAQTDPGWHVYAYAAQNPKKISQPMLIAVVEPGWPSGKVRASAPPIEKETGLKFEPVQRYHEGSVEWTIPITIPAGTAAGRYTVKGLLGYQTCSESQCDQPAGAYFAGTLQVGGTSRAAAPLKFAKGNYRAVDDYLANPSRPADRSAQTQDPDAEDLLSSISFDLTKISVDESTAKQSVAYVLMLATVGGFLLNFMPCVLPVIGLKVMSFVHQAGEDRGRVFTLNLWYALGMLVVFWVLAGLAAAIGLGWGEQYNNNVFTITLLCVVFVMGLSFLGVWEIPIPGFVGTGKANQYAQQEGLAGAFFKGVLTTILATPCSGPGVAAAITWSTNKPASLIYLVFTCMGLGMALPYLIIGAYPRLVRFIPKPGPWMDTFKQTMGFVLMGTVVYMFTLVKSDLVIPTLATIFALWAACWWIGRTPITAEFVTKFKAWIGAVAFAGLVGWFAFGYEPDRTHELPWEEFSLAAFDEHVQANRTVLIDFTADWCPTCKFLEHTVLNTKPIRDIVDQNEVVTLVADWSNNDPEISAMLEALGSKQLPVIAIFPADDPYRPKKLSGGYTRTALQKRLLAAGPSATRIASRSE